MLRSVIKLFCGCSWKASRGTRVPNIKIQKTGADVALSARVASHL
jgi:hypothetical protein